MGGGTVGGRVAVVKQDGRTAAVAECQAEDCGAAATTSTLLCAEPRIRCRRALRAGEFGAGQAGHERGGGRYGCLRDRAATKMQLRGVCRVFFQSDLITIRGLS